MNSTHTLNMDEVVRILVDDLHTPAFVAQTGGGCATIFAGPAHKDADGDDRFAACAGPGSYGWDRGPSMGDWAEFAIGPDDQGEAGYVDAADIGATTEADIAKVLAAQALKDPGVVLTPAEVDALGLDGSASLTPPWLVQQRKEGAARCAVHNTALHAAYENGATPAEAVVAATEATKAWSGTRT